MTVTNQATAPRRRRLRRTRSGPRADTRPLVLTTEALVLQAAYGLFDPAARPAPERVDPTLLDRVRWFGLV
ncbi:MAG TPA: hypothetical protein VIO14_13370 [Dehalococcoidia bacterium]